MDSLFQLGEAIGFLIVPVLILAVVVWPIVFTWLLIRAFRDLHWIQKALWAHYDLARRQVEPPLPAPRHSTHHAGEISTSAFGR